MILRGERIVLQSKSFRYYVQYEHITGVFRVVKEHTYLNT